MKLRKSTISCRVVFSVLTVLLLAFIFGNSAAEGEESGSLSLMVTRWLNSMLDLLHAPFDLAHHTVRKLAHFTEYSLLGASLTGTVWSWSRRAWRFGYVRLPLALGVAAAALDEWLQTFVPDRCGCFSDVLLDCGGVLWAALVTSAVLPALRGRKHNDTVQNS